MTPPPPPPPGRRRSPGTSSRRASITGSRHDPARSYRPAHRSVRGGRPACADHDPAVGQRVRHGHLPRDQAASVNASLPAAREADRGVGPFQPGDMYLLSSGTPAGPARCISRVIASGLVTGPEQAAYAGSDAPQGRWGPTGRIRGPVTGRPNAAAVPAARRRCCPARGDAKLWVPATTTRCCRSVRRRGQRLPASEIPG